MTQAIKQTTKRGLILVLAIITFFSAFSLNQIDAQAANWKTGCFAGKKYTTGHTISLSNKKKDAYITLYTYKKNKKGKGEKCQAFVDILMKTTSGKYIWSGTVFVKKSGKKLKLGKDYTKYVIYFKYGNDNGYFEDIVDWTDPNTVAEPDYWGICYTSNCN